MVKMLTTEVELLKRGVLENLKGRFLSATIGLRGTEII